MDISANYWKVLNQCDIHIHILKISDLQVWDDVERKVKPKEDPFEYKKRITLDQEKSKLSLGEIYEQEYLKQQQVRFCQVWKGDRLKFMNTFRVTPTYLFEQTSHQFLAKVTKSAKNQRNRCHIKIILAPNQKHCFPTLCFSRSWQQWQAHYFFYYL